MSCGLNFFRIITHLLMDSDDDEELLPIDSDDARMVREPPAVPAIRNTVVIIPRSLFTF